jgi:aminoglycoside phosphotransferase (APT) family kinase protein
MAVADIRRLVVEDARLRPEQSNAINEAAESKLVHVRWCMQHNDLHVFNILVGNDGDAIVIDFANVGSAPAAFDPVTLELSVAFHEAAYSRFGGWPTEESAAVWSNLNEYLVGCPYPDFVRACREWAHSTGAGDGEVWASVYAYTIGQLRFDTCPRSFATRLLEHVSEKLIAL